MWYQIDLPWLHPYSSLTSLLLNLQPVTGATSSLAKPMDVDKHKGKLLSFPLCAGSNSHQA